MLNIKPIFLLVLLLSAISLNAQRDTLLWNGLINIQSSLQTGTVEKYGGRAVGQLGVENSKLSVNASLSYTYDRVNGFTIVDDSWNYLLFKSNPKNKIYPLAIGYYGFAKTAGIDLAWVVGVGAGINVIQKSKLNYLSFNVAIADLSFNYNENERQKGVGINLLAQANAVLIKEKVMVNWELHSYYIPELDEVYGMQNNLRLTIPLSKSLGFIVTNNMIYNNVTDLGKKQLNTMTLMGISFRK